MSLSPPPNKDILVDEGGLPSVPWALFLDQCYNGDAGAIWTPTFTNLTVVGTPTITGRYYRISQYLVFFRITITPSTSTSSTAGTTYISNFPLSPRGDGICFAVSGGAGSSSGHFDSSTNRIYVPAWTAVTIPLSILGIVEAR